MLRGSRDRGMKAPLLAVGDSASGLWSALDAVVPTTAHQHCWNHRTLNVQAKLPKALHAEARHRLREMSAAIRSLLASAVDYMWPCRDRVDRSNLRHLSQLHCESNPMPDDLHISSQLHWF